MKIAIAVSYAAVKGIVDRDKRPLFMSQLMAPAKPAVAELGVGRAFLKSVELSATFKRGYALQAMRRPHRFQAWMRPDAHTVKIS